MKKLEILEKIKKTPVFTPKLLKTLKIDYANLYIHRLEKQKLVKRIEKNHYTTYSDPFLIASRIIWPSYLSCWSALKFHNLTEQVPFSLQVVIPYYKKQIVFENTPIIFVTSKGQNFFGYEKINYQGFEIFVADKEKAIIDCALYRKASFSELIDIVKNNFKELDLAKFIRYLKKIGNKSLVKRFGWLFDTLGRDTYKNLKRYIDKVYIPVDYTKRKSNKKNKKWMVIENAQ
jgi:predicted transcriptional regulator of viral defense system